MHVVLGGVVVVEDCVDIFELDKAGVLIGLPELGIRSVEVATTASSHGEGNMGVHEN